MARSSKDDPLFSDVKSNWAFPADAPGNSNAKLQHEGSKPLHYAMKENPNERREPNSYNSHFCKPCNTDTSQDVQYNPPSVNDTNFMSSVPNYSNLGNNQLMRVFYDDKNQPQFMIPVNSQYELFNTNPNISDMKLPNIMNINYKQPGENVEYIQRNVQNSGFISQGSDQQSKQKNSFFFDGLLKNWKPNDSGTYSPFGQQFQMNSNNGKISPQTVNIDKNITNQPHLVSMKKGDSNPSSENVAKKRIVAEVKPMRPSYSDVLTKNPKSSPQIDQTKRVKTPTLSENKMKTNSLKLDKPQAINKKVGSEDVKPKPDKKSTNQMSSGSDSGDVNIENEKPKKANKKSKIKKQNLEIFDEPVLDTKSQFVFINNTTPNKQYKKRKPNEKFDDFETYIDQENTNESNNFVFQESQSDTKAKKKQKEKVKSSKLASEKKRSSQIKTKKCKRGGYIGIIMNYMDNWCSITMKALAWFYYLLSDICHMSAHLSLDLLTVIFTQTYVTTQSTFKSTKDWIFKLKFLTYIDRKFGHTRMGFWRKLSWFKNKEEVDDSESSTSNINIPLPSTGEEAMKRLLACKGKDAYSILGVNANCSDEDIKRYYRRQAFLVHPDKNQLPGAEEAFKILHHAFDMIGEPELREDYDRWRQGSKHVDAACSELYDLLAQLHDKMEFAANTIRCTNCGKRHKRVLTDRPCYAARYCAQCNIRHSAKEGDIWAESSTFGLIVMYYACMDGAVYQITQWASCQKKNLKQLRPDCHAVQYRIVLGNKASPTTTPQSRIHDPNLEEFLNNLYSKSGQVPPTNPKSTSTESTEKTKKRTKKTSKV